MLNYEEICLACPNVMKCSHTTLYCYPIVQAYIKEQL